MRGGGADYKLHNTFVAFEMVRKYLQKNICKKILSFIFAFFQQK